MMKMKVVALLLLSLQGVVMASSSSSVASSAGSSSVASPAGSSSPGSASSPGTASGSASVSSSGTGGGGAGGSTSGSTSVSSSGGAGGSGGTTSGSTSVSSSGGTGGGGAGGSTSGSSSSGGGGAGGTSSGTSSGSSSSGTTGGSSSGTSSGSGSSSGGGVTTAAPKTNDPADGGNMTTAAPTNTGNDAEKQAEAQAVQKATQEAADKLKTATPETLQKSWDAAKASMTEEEQKGLKALGNVSFTKVESQSGSDGLLTLKVTVSFDDAVDATKISETTPEGKALMAGMGIKGKAQKGFKISVAKAARRLEDDERRLASASYVVTVQQKSEADIYKAEGTSKPGSSSNAPRIAGAAALLCALAN